MQNLFHRQEQQQPLTIFYDGKICVADVTELQVYIYVEITSFFFFVTLNHPSADLNLFVVILIK